MTEETGHDMLLPHKRIRARLEIIFRFLSGMNIRHYVIPFMVLCVKIYYHQLWGGHRTPESGDNENKSENPRPGQMTYSIWTDVLG